jgi:hypothetical protein
VLKRLAELFGVTLDDLTRETPAEGAFIKIRKLLDKHKRIIPFLAAGLVWLAATVAFVFLNMFGKGIAGTWLAFVYAVPVSVIVLLVFNSIWGKKILSAVLVSVLVWSVPAVAVLTIAVLPGAFADGWMLMLIAVPLQVLVGLWYGMRVERS